MGEGEYPIGIENEMANLARSGDGQWARDPRTGNRTWSTPEGEYVDPALLLDRDRPRKRTIVFFAVAGHSAMDHTGGVLVRLATEEVAGRSQTVGVAKSALARAEKRWKKVYGRRTAPTVDYAIYLLDRE